MTELVTYQPQSVVRTMDEAERAAGAMAASGFFSDTKQAAQALVKILAGQEMGFGPFAAMTGVHVIQGKPSIGANLMAAAVKRSGRYDYRVTRLDDTGCEVVFFDGGREVGRSSFTAEDAEKAQVGGKDNWKKYTSDMLFARAISRGARRFAPGIFGGSPVYTPDEMGVDTDEEGYIQVDGSPAKPEQSEQPGEDVEEGEFTEPMTIERASQITNSEGEFYAQLSDDKLSMMSIGIGKALSKPDLTPEKAQEYLEKQEAIKVILQARADGSIN